MRTFGRVVWIVLGALLTLLLVGPFLIPIPPLKGTLPPEQLADMDSRFLEVNGLRVHYKIAGQGKPALVLLHGFGASVFSWREVMAPLAERATVIAFDRPGFGLTSRPMRGQWSGPNPYSQEAQADLTVALLDKLGIQEAVLVGNSAGGTVAILTALRHPQRVRALVLVDAAVYVGGGAPAWIRALAGTPQMDRLGPLLVRSIRSRGEALLELAWHDPGKITPEIKAGYLRPLQAQDWDRALWETVLASRPLKLEERLKELQVPVLVISGDDDRVVPTAQSVRLAQELPQAKLAILPDCGHVPQEECPEAFLREVSEFLGALPLSPIWPSKETFGGKSGSCL